MRITYLSGEASQKKTWHVMTVASVVLCVIMRMLKEDGHSDRFMLERLDELPCDWTDDMEAAIPKQ